MTEPGKKWQKVVKGDRGMQSGHRGTGAPPPLVLSSSQGHVMSLKVVRIAPLPFPSVTHPVPSHFLPSPIHCCCCCLHCPC